MFLGHVNDFANNTYTPLEQLDNKWVLVRENDQFSIISNVCPHQKSLISKKAGTGIRVCPYHSWSFAINGDPVKSGRTEYYCKNEKALDKIPVHVWNNLVFAVPVDCKELNFVDFKSMQLVEKRIDTVYAQPENIMDLFLDVDHIDAVHSGVYDQIGLTDIDTVEWTFYSNGSLQLVPGGQGYGAAWLAVYPGSMIEWQPGALFITVAIRDRENKSKVLVYKYKDTTASEQNYALNETVWEQAWSQDKEQAELLTEFNQSNLEDSKQHFRKFLSC